MIRCNVKFMKCTEHWRITNTCSAGNQGDMETILQMCVQMLLCFALIVFFFRQLSATKWLSRVGMYTKGGRRFAQFLLTWLAVRLLEQITAFIIIPAIRPFNFSVKQFRHPDRHCVKIPTWILWFPSAHLSPAKVKYSTKQSEGVCSGNLALSVTSKTRPSLTVMSLDFLSLPPIVWMCLHIQNVRVSRISKELCLSNKFPSSSHQ